MAIILSVFLRGYRGKTVDFALTSSSHRTTIAHFLNNGKWQDDQLQSILKASIIEIIYSEARKSGQPVLCIIDDTIASHTKPSSLALHPIEAAYYHQSHFCRGQALFYASLICPICLVFSIFTLEYNFA